MNENGDPTITGKRYWYHREIEAALRDKDGPMYWVIRADAARLCLFLTFLAGFMVGAAVMAWVVLH